MIPYSPLLSPPAPMLNIICRNPYDATGAPSFSNTIGSRSSCHAEGETIAKALENVQDVARNIIGLMEGDGSPLPRELQKVTAGVKLHNSWMR